MQRSGFFNAILSNGEYDRKYNANDYCDNLAVVISNGVLRGSGDDLKVTAAGMLVTVGTGRAWIDGHYYINDTPHTFSAVAAPVGGARYDRVVLRLDKSIAVRSVSLVYVQGTAGNNPTKPAPVREGNIYDIVIADVYVTSGAASVSITDQRQNKDVCGWVYSTSGDNSFFVALDNAFNEWFAEKKDTLASVTLFKKYDWRTKLTAATHTTTFNIPQYNAETCYIEVFVNGILSTAGEDYTFTNGGVLTFAYTLAAGTEVEVKCYKSIDGTGINSVADEIAELQNAVAALTNAGEYTYICNGYDDNVKLSEIAQAWLAGGADSKKTKITVYGTFGAAAPYAGSGTEAAGFQWLALGTKEASSRKIVFDFTAVNSMNFTCNSTKDIIFYGADVHVIGANVQAAGTGANNAIIMFSGRVGEIKAEQCSFSITTSGTATVAESGTFINCKTWIYSTTNNATTFAPVTNSRPVVVFGGTHYAYCADNYNHAGCVFYTAATATNAVMMAFGVNVPTATLSGFYQTNAARINAGKVYISGITTTLAVTKNEYCEVNGHIAINKA